MPPISCAMPQTNPTAEYRIQMFCRQEGRGMKERAVFSACTAPTVHLEWYIKSGFEQSVKVLFENLKSLSNVPATFTSDLTCCHGKSLWWYTCCLLTGWKSRGRMWSTNSSIFGMSNSFNEHILVMASTALLITVSSGSLRPYR